MEPYWESSSVHHHPIKYESENGVSYPFCTSENGPGSYGPAMTYSEDDTEFAPKRVKPTRQDPLSHRIIEKRRRDRMNSCLADLSRLIPPQYQRKSRGRIEKTEIIEMAIKHIKNIQAKADGSEAAAMGSNGTGGGAGVGAAVAARQCFQVDQYREGYHECLTTAVQFLIEISAHFEEICYKMVSHLREHFNDVIKGEHCANSNTSNSSSGGGGGGRDGLGNFSQIKRRHLDNGSPPSTTTGSLNGLSHLLLANGAVVPGAGGLSGENRAGCGLVTTNGPRIAHLCGSINGHSSSNGGVNGLLGGERACPGGGQGEGVPSSSDAAGEMNCAKDLSCRGAAAAAAGTTSSTSGGAGAAGATEAAAAGGKGKPPQQTPVITSTACSTSLVQSSSSTCSINCATTAELLINAETESSSSALDHGCVMETSSGRGGLMMGERGERSGECPAAGTGMVCPVGSGSGGGGGGSESGGGLLKVHNLTETSCDGVEHHYKYKNYMQQRFSQDRFHHDEHIVSNSSNELHDDHHDHPMGAPSMAAMNGVGNGGGLSAAAIALNGGNRVMAPPPEPTDSNCSVDTFVAFNAKRAAAAAALEGLKGGGAMGHGRAGGDEGQQHLAAAAAAALMLRDHHHQAQIKEEKMDTSSSSPAGSSEALGKVLMGPDVGSVAAAVAAARMVEGNQQVPRVKAKSRFASMPVPIFALHSHGSFYIPLTVDYDALVPYLGEVNLLDKNMAAIKALHPININIYAPF